MHFVNIVQDLSYQKLLAMAVSQVKDTVSIKNKFGRELDEYLMLKNAMNSFFQTQLKRII